VTRILIFGAAGYGNLGDDAVLEGMLAQLRDTVEAEFTVVGGPFLEAAARLNVRAIAQEDAAAWLDAIEASDLVLIGGGGLLYDSTFIPALAELLAPRSNSLYQSAKIASAARIAGKPVALVGIGVGPLLTDGGRSAARFVADCAQWITTRDEHSERLLLELRVPRARVHVACDPAVFLPPPPPGAGREWLTRRGLDALPRPWIGLNARPWHHFPTLGGAQQEPGRELRAALAAVAQTIIARTGGSLFLVPVQTAFDDDREVLAHLRDVIGSANRVSLIEDPGDASMVQALIGELDLMVGMRLHSLIFAANAGTPFIALSYDPKVDAFAAAMAATEFCFPIEGLAAEGVATAVEKALHEREALRERVAEAAQKMRARGAISAHLAAESLKPRGDQARLAQHRAGLHAEPGPPAPSDAMPRILMQIRPDYETNPGGGDLVQLWQTKAALERLGVPLTVSGELYPDLESFDVVHTFHLTQPVGAFEHCANARRQGRPVVLSPVYWDARELLYQAPRMLDPQYEPIPQAVALYAAMEAKAATLVAMADVLAPNSQAERDLLARSFGVAPESCVIVPNGVEGRFFDAAPDEFAGEYGRRDFVLCVGRIEQRKNQVALLAALKETNLPLVLIGQASDQAYFERCRAEFTEHVTYIPGMPPEQMPSAYAAARVHVLPSWYDTPGLVSLEAAVAGCNIVSTDRGSPREYFGDMAWYCSPDDLGSIRRAVLAAWEAPRSDRLRHHVRRNFTWDIAAQRTLDAYRAALALRARPRAQDEIARQAAQLEAALQYVRALQRAMEVEREEFRRHSILMEQRAQSAEENARSTYAYAESVERSCRREIQAITSRRLYRWSEWLALRLKWLLRRR